MILSFELIFGLLYVILKICFCQALPLSAEYFQYKKSDFKKLNMIIDISILLSYFKIVNCTGLTFFYYYTGSFL